MPHLKRFRLNEVHSILKVTLTFCRRTCICYLQQILPAVTKIVVMKRRCHRTTCHGGS